MSLSENDADHESVKPARSLISENELIQRENFKLRACLLKGIDFAVLQMDDPVHYFLS